MRSLRISNGCRAAMLPGSISRNYVVNSARFYVIRVEVSLNTPAQLSLPLYLPDDETFASFWPGITPLYWPRYKTCCAGNIVDISTFGRVKARAAAICCTPPALNCRSVEMR